jgi:hypothetical protein
VFLETLETQGVEGIKGQGSKNPGPLLVWLQLHSRPPQEAGDPLPFG